MAGSIKRLKKHGPIDKIELGGLEKHGPVDKSPWLGRLNVLKSMTLSSNRPSWLDLAALGALARPGWLDLAALAALARIGCPGSRKILLRGIFLVGLPK
mgnify:CR=1 FL=1